MDYTTVLLVLFFASSLLHVLNSYAICRKSARFPPGPYSLPVVGDIFRIGRKPHRSLANLSKTYGPLMSLKLGSLTTIVVSSSKVAKELFTKHDHFCSTRSIPDVIRALDHDRFSIAWMPANNKWRNLRKLCKEQLFLSQQLDSNQDLRQEKVQELLAFVEECCKIGKAVDIGRVAFTTTLNLMSNTFFSLDLAPHGSESSQEFKHIACGVMQHVGKANLADYFPILKRADPQGIRQTAGHYFKKFFDIFEGIINRRLESSASSPKNDVLEALLDINKKNDSELSLNDIKHLLLDLFLAGTDTTSGTIEWAMTELLRSTEKMTKARCELEEILGKDVQVQETDISRLPYLRAIIKETLRLYPPAPIILPRKPDVDLEIQGFNVPKNAHLVINVWAIGRDSGIWQNSDSFLPERFLESKLDFKGQNFELIPFGAGRRMCPGLPLGHRMVHHILASLLHSFNWKLEQEVKPETLDMNEHFGLSLQKAIPLKAIPVKK